MATLELSKKSLTDVDAGVVAVFAAKGDGTDAPPVLGADALAAGQALDVDLPAELAAVRFEGGAGAVARIPTRGKAKAAVLLVVGLGPAAKADAEALRRAAGVAARNATKDTTLAVVVPADLLDRPPGDDLDAAARAQAVAEGALLGSYAFTTYRTKTDDLPSLEQVLILAGEGLSHGDLRSGTEAGAAVATATMLARDLVNEPPQAKRPPALADRMAALARDAGLEAKVWDEKALAKGGFGGILGVGQGSSEPPRMVELTYAPSRAKSHVVLVGKGITFDSGGLSLKPPDAMTTMKSDMSGAAAVVATMSALAALDVTVKVTGLVALAENMPSGTAIRVSDVLTHRGGKTVEVLNTDAEGRLVLADALAYAAEAEPDAIIDVATLTGAQVVALGSRIAGLMGSDDDLVREVEAAAEAAGERVWHLPLPEDYAEWLRSDVADLKNIGKGREAGTLIGGLFLKEFTDGRPWVHLDIAGPAFTGENEGGYSTKGGTGFGVRTLLRFLQRRS
jgi:leucyl aminopeptidase